MSEILACPNCDGPLTDSWLERAMDGSSGKRCEECTKAYWNPYGAARELPLRRRQLVETGNELARVTGDLTTATTALEVAQAQIAALKVEVAGMMKERDEARDREDFYRDDRDYWKGHCDRMSREQGTIMDARLACETMRKERDAALADLRQARVERNEAETKHYRDVARITEKLEAAIARAEAAEARVRELEARNGR